MIGQFIEYTSEKGTWLELVLASPNGILSVKVYRALRGPHKVYTGYDIYPPSIPDVIWESVAESHEYYRKMDATGRKFNQTPTSIQVNNLSDFLTRYAGEWFVDPLDREASVPGSDLNTHLMMLAGVLEGAPSSKAAAAKRAAAATARESRKIESQAAFNSHLERDPLWGIF